MAVLLRSDSTGASRNTWRYATGCGVLKGVCVCARACLMVLGCLYAWRVCCACCCCCCRRRSIAQRLAASPNFQVLVTSRMLPIQPYLYKLGEVPCAYSHTGDGRAHIYVKSLAHAPPAVLARLWCKDGMCWLPGTSQMQLSIAEDVPITAINPAKYVALAGDAAVAGGAADALEYGLKPQGQQGGPATE